MSIYGVRGAEENNDVNLALTLSVLLGKFTLNFLPQQVTATLTVKSCETEDSKVPALRQ